MSATTSRVLTDEQAIAALTSSLSAVFDQAQAEEERAPKPSTPLPKKNEWMQQPGPGSFRLSIMAPGSGTGAFIDGANGPIGARYFQAEATSVIQTTRAQEDRSLEFTQDDRVFGSENAPAGFSVRLTGRHTNSVGGPTLALIPLDVAKAEKKLYRLLKKMLRDDLGSPKFTSDEMANTDAKVPVPPFTKINLSGPLDAIDFEVPTAASKKFPTAADAVRAQDAILRAKISEAMKQLRQVNNGVSPTNKFSE